MKTEKTLRESFEEELTQVSNKDVFDSGYRKKKFFFWTIRTSVLIILYMIFWKHEWVRKSLYIIMPLSLFSLFTIVAMPFLINRKIQKTKQKIDEAEKAIKKVMKEKEAFIVDVRK